MKAMTKQMIDYCDNLRVNYLDWDTAFRVTIMGEEYTIQRLSLRYWKCLHNGVTTMFRSQSEVIDWLDSKW